MKDNSMGKANIKFEEALKTLENLVSKLENGNIPLDDSIKTYEQAMELVRICNNHLDSAEGKVRVLVEGADGSITDQPYLRKNDET